jgi:hypothetical protein
LNSSKCWHVNAVRLGKFSRGRAPHQNSDSLGTMDCTTTKNLDIHHVVDFAKSASEGQRDEDTDAVGLLYVFAILKAYSIRGLDNAGKTTIVKRIMNEDVNSVSPTLGFIIKTIEYDGYEIPFKTCRRLTTEATN